MTNNSTVKEGCTTGGRTRVSSILAVNARRNPRLHRKAAMTDPSVTTLRLDQPGIRAALGDLEAEIMEAVWRRPNGDWVTVREIWDELHPKRSIMYTTVMNTMTRLARKRLLVAERRGKAFAYRPALSRDAFVDHFVSEAIEHLLLNFSGATRSRLRGVTDPARQERLVRLLQDVESQRAAEEQS